MQTDVDTATNAELRAIREHLRRAAIRDDLLVPRSIDFYAAGTTPASGNFMLIPEPSGPPAGFLWHVRYLIFSSAAAATTASAGTGHVYIGPRPTRDVADQSGMWRDKTREAFPTSAPYDRGQMVVNYPESIYALIVAGAASTSYIFAGTVEQIVDTLPQAAEVYNLG